jgi:hypothetical protein
MKMESPTRDSVPAMVCSQRWRAIWPRTDSTLRTIVDHKANHRHQIREGFLQHHKVNIEGVRKMAGLPMYARREANILHRALCSPIGSPVTALNWLQTGCVDMRLEHHSELIRKS